MKIQGLKVDLKVSRKTERSEIKIKNRRSKIRKLEGNIKDE